MSVYENVLPENLELNILQRKISHCIKVQLLIQQGNAACVIGTAPSSRGLEGLFDFVLDEPEPWDFWLGLPVRTFS